MDSLATWLGVILTAAALGAAIIGSRIAWRVYQIESERDRLAEGQRELERLEKKKKQASLISAWIEMRPMPNSDEGYLVILVRNASELPVYGLAVGVFDFADSLLAKETISVLPPSASPIEFPQPAICGNRFHSDRANMFGNRVRFRFQDVAGVAWLRGVNGELDEVPDKKDLALDSLGPANPPKELE